MTNNPWSDDACRIQVVTLRWYKRASLLIRLRNFRTHRASALVAEGESERERESVVKKVRANACYSALLAAIVH